MEYEDNGRVTWKGESSRDQEGDVQPERGARCGRDMETGRREGARGDKVGREERSEIGGKGEEETQRK